MVNKFLGFEQPTRSPDAYMWVDRLQSLAFDHTNKWAKYGPYKTQNAAYHAKLTAEKYKNKLYKQGYDLETYISTDENNQWYLYIIARISDNGV